MLYQLTPTETGVRSSTRHAPWVRQSGRGAPRLGAVSGDRRGGVTGARDDLLLRRSPRDAGALTRRGPRVRRLAIPIQLLLLPVAVPPFFEGLDLGGGRTRIPPQRQDGGPDGHAGGRGTMPGLAMRTPHHGRQDLSRVAYRLEGGIEPIAEAEQGVHGQRRIPCLPHHRDQLWEPDLLGIAGSHTSPLSSRGLLCAARSHTCHGYGLHGM